FAVTVRSPSMACQRYKRASMPYRMLGDGLRLSMTIQSTYVVSGPAHSNSPTHAPSLVGSGKVYAWPVHATVSATITWYSPAPHAAPVRVRGPSTVATRAAARV